MERKDSTWLVMKMAWRREIGGIEYEFKRKARYIDGYYYCSKCGVWARRVDLETIKRCPICNTRVRYQTSAGKTKRYITVINE